MCKLISLSAASIRMYCIETWDVPFYESHIRTDLVGFRLCMVI